MDGQFLDQPISAGVYQIDASQYHNDPCPEPSLSSTLAKVMLAQSPLHAWTASPRLNPQFEPVEKKTFDIGRAAHRAVLGAGGDYVEIPSEYLKKDGSINGNSNAYKEWDADVRSSGATPLKADQIAAIEAMRDIAHARLGSMGIDLDPACSEQVAIAQIDGVWCRAMLDNVPLDPRLPIYDFKTCESAAPEACLKSVINYGYEVQAEHYRQVWKAATGQERAFRFIFQEKAAPNEVCVVELGSETLTIARKKIARAREMWRICLRDQSWPGYPPGVHRMDLPAWAIERWLERESAEADHKQRHGADIIEAARLWQAPEGYQGATA